MSCRTVPALFGLLVVSACGDDATIRPGEDAGFDAGEAPAASAMVGPEGGGLVVPGMMALGIPAGALTTMTQVSVFMEDSPPAGFTETMGPVLRFEPSGLTFAEPVLINVEAPPTFAGRLFWSREDGSGYDPIGFVEFGKARAYVTHFSTAVMSGMGCEDTLIDNNQICECFNGTPPAFADGYGVLCINNPGMDQCQFDLTDHCMYTRYGMDGMPAYRGRDGDACNGFGRPGGVADQCYCVAESGPATGISLCPNPFDFTGGMMVCPCGIHGFAGEKFGTSSGYYVADSGPPDYIRRNEMASCRFNECDEVRPAAAPYESMSGVMTSCVPEGPPDPPEYPDGAPPMEPPPMDYPPMMEAPAMMPSVDCPAM